MAFTSINTNTLFFIGLAVFLLYIIYIIYKSNKQYNYGELIGSFNGVNAYSNQQGLLNSDETNHYNGIYTGIKWQCVEYARRYLIVRHGITFSDVNNAYEITRAKFTKLNGNSVIMNNNVAVGSLIIWPQYYKTDGYEGHVAVVSSISAKGIRVAEQNNDDNEFNRFIPFTDLQNVIFLSVS
jgi:hypothetical protein